MNQPDLGVNGEVSTALDIEPSAEESTSIPGEGEETPSVIVNAAEKSKPGRPNIEQAAINQAKRLQLEQVKRDLNPPIRASSRIAAKKT